MSNTHSSLNTLKRFPTFRTQKCARTHANARTHWKMHLQTTKHVGGHILSSSVFYSLLFVLAFLILHIYDVKNNIVSSFSESTCLDPKLIKKKLGVFYKRFRFGCKGFLVKNPKSLIFFSQITQLSIQIFSQQNMPIRYLNFNPSQQSLQPSQWN